MSPWRTWRHYLEAKARGEDVATQQDIARALREVARMMLVGQALVLAILGGGLWLQHHVAEQADRDRERAALLADQERDRSFDLICSVLQQNAETDADFANAVVRLIRPVTDPPLPPVVKDVRATAAAVRDRNEAFAAAKCTSRDDLARLLERDVLAPPAPRKETAP